MSSSRSSVASPDVNVGSGGAGGNAVGDPMPMSCGDVSTSSVVSSCCPAASNSSSMAIASAGNG